MSGPNTIHVSTAEAMMRERHTFMVFDGFRQTPDTLQLSKEKLELIKVPGARQDRGVYSKSLLHHKV